MRGKFFNRICRGNGFYNYYAQRTVHPLLQCQWCAVLQHGSDGDRQTVVWRYLDNIDPVTSYTISQSREEQLEYLLVTAAEIGTFSRYVDIRTVSNLTICEK